MKNFVKEWDIDKNPRSSLFKEAIKYLDRDILFESSPNVDLFYIPLGVYLGLYKKDKRILITLDDNRMNYPLDKKYFKEVVKTRKKYAKKIIVPYVEYVLDTIGIKYKEVEE